MHSACMQAIRNHARLAHNPHLYPACILRYPARNRCCMCSRDHSRRT